MTAKKRLSLLAAATALTATSAPAAPIYWTVYDIADDATQVSTDGSVVEAHGGVKVGGAGTTGATIVVNTVTFDDSPVGDTVTHNDGVAVPDMSAPNDNYEFMLDVGDRNSSGEQSFTFSGLTLGNTYQIQIWHTDNRSSAGKDGMVLNDGGIATTPDPATSGHATLLQEVVEDFWGQYAIGVFVADDTTQQFLARRYTNLDTTPSTSSNLTIHGVQLRDLGVDSSAPSPAPTIATLTPFETSVVVEASTDTTDQTGVEYRFTRRLGLGGAVQLTSDWQDSTTFTDTGLNSSTEYSYTVTARDKTPTGYETAESAEVTVTTLDPDNTDPEPATMSFAVAPATTEPNYSAITMTAVTATDLSGVEYYFDETSGNPGGDDSGWQDSPVYTDTGLQPNTEYTYTVQARDKSVAQNTNTVSSAESVTTDPKGNATITWAVSDITDDPGNVSNSGTPVAARTGGATRSATVNGVAFDSVQDSGNLMDSIFAIDGLGSGSYGGVTDSGYRNLLYDGQRSGRPGNEGGSLPRIPPTEDWATVEFFGLTPGNTYQIQVWATDVRGNPEEKSTVLSDGDTGAPVRALDGSNELLWEVNGGVAGQYATGTFVADAPNQAFNVQKWENLLTTPVARTQDHWLNGWQIRDLGSSAPDYDTWGTAQNWSFGDPGTGEADDYDLDGWTNDEERIFGLDPADPSSVNPFETPLDPAGGTFSYTRRTQSLTGLVYQIWYSTDLVEWFQDAAANQTPGSPTNDVELVAVQVSPSLLTQSRLFIQIRAGNAEVVPPPPAPELSSLWGSGTTITLNFTEELSEGPATDTTNYTVELDGGGAVTVTGASLGGEGKTVTLTLGSALGIDSSYNVTLSNLTGSNGWPLGGDSTAQFQTWDNDPTGIKVFILAGQSNMVGYGKTEQGGNPDWTEGGEEPKEITGGLGCLRYLANNNASFPEYDYTSLLVDPGQPATSDWRTRSDVKVWWHNGSSGNLGGAIQKGDLGPPFQGANANWFGPEYAFGQVLGDHYASNDVLIIKTAWGGRALASDFRPPSAVAARGGVVGPFYEAIFDDVHEVLSNLGTEFPEWTGMGYQIAGFGWHQGYNDRVNGTFSAEYDENLPDLISDVRAEFGKPDLPFVIATTGMGNAGPVEAPPYSGYTAVEKAQLWVAGVAQPADVLSDDTRPYWRDKTIAPSTLGHHWNHSGESYFLIGKAMGDNMVTLLTP